MKRLLVLIILLTAAPLDAATYWVSQSGNDGNQHCFDSATQPALSNTSRTINQGVSCLKSGDTLNIMAGDYGGQSVWSIRNSSPNVCDSSGSPCPPNGTPGKYTTIQAAPGAERKVRFNLPGEPVMRFQGYVSWIAFKGLDLDSASMTTGQGGGINGDCAAPNFDCIVGGKVDINAVPNFMLFENNIMRNARPSGIHGFYNTTVRGNDIFNNGTDIQLDHGVYMGGDNNIIEYNRVHNNAAFGIQIRKGGDGAFVNNIIRGNLSYNNNTQSGITIEWGPHYIYNNVTYGNPAAGIQAQDAFQNTIVNNTSYNENKCVALTNNANDNIVRNNLCANSAQGFTVDNPSNSFNNNISSNVQTSGAGIFVNAAGENFQLASGTGQATNAGVSFSSIFTIDANSINRPQGSAWDIGACEWFSGAAKCPNLAGTSTPPPPVNAPSISITGPVSGGRYITTVQNQIITGSADCAAGAFASIAWSNNQGGSGNASGTTSWTLSSTLTPYQINTITVTVNCTGTSPPAATTSIQVAYNPPELIGAYAFDTNSGTTATDASTKGNTGTLTGPVTWTTTKKKFGVAGLDFGGGSVTIAQNGNNNKILGGFSFVLSGVQPDAVYNDFRALVVNQYVQYLYATTTGQATGCAATVPMLGFSDGATNYNLCAPVGSPLQTGVNTCIAGTYDGTALKIYINKVEVANQTRSYEFPAAPSSGWFIGNSGFSTEGFDGGIDEVRIYNYGIGAAQIATDCDTQIGSPPPTPPSGVKIGSVPIRIGDKEFRIGF